MPWFYEYHNLNNNLKNSVNKETEKSTLFNKQEFNSILESMILFF